MYLGRVLHHGPEGPEPRIVAATHPGTGWVDVRSSERLRLQRAGSGASAACKVAAAIVPASMAAALDSGWGGVLEIGNYDDDAYTAAVRDGCPLAPVLGGLRGLGRRYALQIRTGFPEIPRQVSGYSRDQLLGIVRSLARPQTRASPALRRLSLSPPRRRARDPPDGGAAGSGRVPRPFRSRETRSRSHEVDRP